MLRDEGEAYARKLDAAGVEVTAVRYNVISQIPGTRSAMQQAAAALKANLQ